MGVVFEHNYVCWPDVINGPRIMLKKINPTLENENILELPPFEFRCYIRANAGQVELCEALAAYCDGTEVLSDKAGVVEVITGKLTKPELDKIRAQFAGIESVIRVLD